MRPDAEVLADVEVARVGGRRLEAPAVDVEALLGAERARREALREAGGDGEALPVGRELLEHALGVRSRLTLSSGWPGCTRGAMSVENIGM